MKIPAGRSRAFQTDRSQGSRPNQPPPVSDQLESHNTVHGYRRGLSVEGEGTSGSCTSRKNSSVKLELVRGAGEISKLLGTRLADVQLTAAAMPIPQIQRTSPSLSFDPPTHPCHCGSLSECQCPELKSEDLVSTVTGGWHAAGCPLRRSEHSALKLTHLELPTWHPGLVRLAAVGLKQAR
jgi:hypothetical protein